MSRSEQCGPDPSAARASTPDGQAEPDHEKIMKARLVRGVVQFDRGLRNTPARREVDHTSPKRKRGFGLPSLAPLLNHASCGVKPRATRSVRHGEHEPISLWQIEALVATMFLEDQPVRSLRWIFLWGNNIRNKYGRCQAPPGLSKSGRKWQDLRKIQASVHQCTRGVTNQGFQVRRQIGKLSSGRMVIADTIVVRRGGGAQNWPLPATTLIKLYDMNPIPEQDGIRGVEICLSGQMV
jgi:hypothetical protein